ncbi:MAG: DcaP family trimeric outer membrane transporter [Alphaproteobacteria bacterium]|nr:DcaP family trimeric outer membrane transporter [Alphaproteobacteria bacterium]
MVQTSWRSALLGSGAAVALLAASVPASADQIDELRSQIQSLQDKMSQLEKSQVSKRRVAPAAAVESGAKPRSWKLPGTNTSMQIGGYAKLDLIYDINASSGDLLLAGPAEGSAAARAQGNFRLHARQSRFWIRTWTPTDWGELETHLQGDFFGTGGNQLVSNSNSLRLRHAYGRLGPVLAGQTWSNFMPLHALPETLDFAGPRGVIFVRQAQIRYTHSFGGGTALVLSIENPQTLAAAYGGAPLVAGPDGLPDFVVRLQHRWSAGMVSVAALIRQLQVDDGAGTQDTDFGWGIHFGTGVRFNNKKTAAGLLVYYGDGIGRYSAAYSDAVLNGPGGASAKLDAVTLVGGLVWLQHRWTDTLRSTIVYGRNWNDVAGSTSSGVGGLAGKAGVAAGTTQDVWSIHANLLWSPVPKTTIGVEYVYQFDGFVHSANGTVHRVQVAFKYSF